MAEHSHAEHRPPPPGEEAGFHNPEHMGVLYPEHDFVAVIDDWQQAQRAVQALKALGIAEADIDLLDNARARALDREAMQQQGLGDKLKRALSLSPDIEADSWGTARVMTRSESELQG